MLAGPVESKEYETRLQSLLDHRNLTGIATVMGPVSGEDKWQLFRRAGIFCYPSCHPGETFGLAAVEAMCFGIPVVASSWRGLAEVVEDGVTGLLTPPGDPGALAEALMRLLGDPVLRVELGEAGRQRYLRSYTVEQHRLGMQAAFDEVISGLRGQDG